MVNTYTEEKIDQRLSSFPNEIQDYIFSDKVTTAINQIISDRDFKDPDSFTKDIFMLLIGLKDINEFEKDLIGREGIEEDESSEIVMDIDDEILSGAREIAQKLKEPEQKTQTITPESFLPKLEKKPEAPVPVNLPTGGNVPAPAIKTQVPEPKPGFVPVGFKPAPVSAEPKPAPTAPVTPVVAKPAPSMLDAKLSQSVNIPTETKEVKASYEKDPYREPLE